MHAIIRLFIALTLVATASLLKVPATRADVVTQPVLETPLPEPYANRWIEVDLTTLTAIAWEGNTQVYTALVSAGRPGFETPTGSFRIVKRIANETMDSATVGIPRGAPGSYYVTNVRYTQYFTNTGNALHANYWSLPSVFGSRNDSHGCVGMLTDDAAFFWDFATIGTPVIVHKSDKAVIPSVVGLTSDEANAKLAEAGFQVQTDETRSNDFERGQVTAQSPDSGTLLERGSAVTVTVCTGPLVAPVQPPEGNVAWVPEIVGLPEEEARQRISEAGLNAGYSNYQTEADIDAGALPFFQSVKPGAVLSSQPAYGATVAKGSTVQLAVRQP
jgi:hypothetical protein